MEQSIFQRTIMKEASVLHWLRSIKTLFHRKFVQVYAGELKDDQGNVLVKDGEVMSDDDILAQDFFVDNVIGGKK